MNEIERTENFLCCDLSLNRPGFAVLSYDNETGKASVLETSYINNHQIKPVPEKLMDVVREIDRYVHTYDGLIPVREKGFVRYQNETIALAKVAGAADIAVWNSLGKEFYEMAPVMIKKVVTNNARASKEEVAEALKDYVGEREYAVDDESDAVAVGVAWLIRAGKLPALKWER